MNKYYIDKNSWVHFGEDMKLGTEWERSPIFENSWWYEKELKEIIKKGENLNVLNEKIGRTPISVAAELGNSKVFEALIQNGADVTIPDADGKTAIDYATSEEIKRLIEGAVKSKTAKDYTKGNLKKFFEKVSQKKKKTQGLGVPKKRYERVKTREGIDVIVGVETLILSEPNKKKEGLKGALKSMKTKVDSRVVKKLKKGPHE